MDIYSAVFIFCLLYFSVYGDKNTELQSPEEELYGVKYAQACEGIIKECFIGKIVNEH